VDVFHFWREINNENTPDGFQGFASSGPSIILACNLCLSVIFFRHVAHVGILSWQLIVAGNHNGVYFLLSLLSFNITSYFVKDCM